MTAMDEAITLAHKQQRPFTLLYWFDNSQSGGGMYLLPWIQLHWERLPL